MATTITKSEELRKRTEDFAHRCVKFAVALEGTRLGNHIAGQLIRCSTSVAANYRACCLAQSRRDFTAKLSIVLEEIDESVFWIEFTLQEKMVKKIKLTYLLKEANELNAIFYSSRKTLKSVKNKTRTTIAKS